MTTNTIATTTQAFIATINDNVDLLTIAVTIIIAILGWFVTLILQRSNIKMQHKVNIQYDIYKQFTKLYINTQNSLSKLGARSSPPFILMESCMISFNVKLISEQEAVFKGNQEWTKFVNGLFDLYNTFSDNYLLLLYLFENWLAAFKPLGYPKKNLEFQINILKENIYNNLSTLQMYNIKHGNDWRQWKQNEVEIITQDISEAIYNIGVYLGDFMVLLHNKLLSKYFRKKRPTRKTLNPKYKVLTEKGIIKNLDRKLIAKMKIFKVKHTAKVSDKLKSTTNNQKYKEFLTSLEKEICFICNNRLEVINFIESKEGFCFQYTCGHKWEE